MPVRYPQLETRADEVHDVAPAALPAAGETAELLVRALEPWRVSSDT